MIHLDVPAEGLAAQCTSLGDLLDDTPARVEVVILDVPDDTFTRAPSLLAARERVAALHTPLLPVIAEHLRAIGRLPRWIPFPQAAPPSVRLLPRIWHQTCAPVPGGGVHGGVALDGAGGTA